MRKTVYDRLYDKFGSASIRYKLFLIFVLLLLVPFILFMIVNSYITSSESEHQAINNSERELQQASFSLSEKLTYLKGMVNILATNQSIINIAAKNSQDYENNMGLWYNDSQNFLQITDMVEIINPNLSLLKFTLYMRDGLARVTQTPNFQMLSSASNTPWYHKLSSNNQRLFIFSNDQSDHTVSYTRWISSSSNYEDYLAIIKASLPTDSVDALIKNSLPTENSTLMLVDDLANSVSILGNKKNAGIGDVNKEVNRFIFNGDTNFHKTITINGRRELLVICTIAESGWNLVLVEPYQDILANNANTMKRVLLLLLICVPLTLPLSFFVSSSVTKRLRSLSKHMKQLENGNYDINILPSSNDEIGQVIKNYNYMLTKTSMLLDDRYRLGKQIKNLELLALQSQINPHFLHNTLDLIYWKSMKYKAKEIGTIITDLSKFYKICLSNGDSFIPIERELAHVSAYVSIQNVRFSDKIRFEIDVPESLYGYKIPKMIFQPLVENAILHGICEKDSGTGTVKITGEQIGKDIFFYIQDDGVGIPPDRLRQILEKPLTGKKQGYGVFNVNERLKLCFGEDYGLSYCSSIGGTSVTIKIRTEIINT